MEAALRDHPDSDQVIDSLTPAQRFFVSWGQFWRTKSRDDYLIKQLASDPHSPGNIRAFVPPSNLEEFHAAFEINETNKMYLAPEKRGNVW
ncbi:hypothetical protein SARC_13086 [Sphaeroforma arctica JP610]|uniref:Peptidase M13 C-terminal domain-containing protein n=1 Tax=Sphaeroforma arctica JP610 TaxID=667725 RepID=A0A0L0FC75_9EUKA|nr:hypothetical protein SARC_13086 [Sphaeroforma arctica JP610]KNC74365.1 hypothetical protein SARC_13086 [Sphaeroforma arctica JP610]|eukprot:XP_014148267.1 hypothetical protein SARC_13086 [Sphaeroforma arctica JP610]